MKHRLRKLTLRFVMIAILLLANLPMYNGIVGADSDPEVNSYVTDHTETSATIHLNATGFSSEATYGILLGNLEDLTDGEEIAVTGSTNSRDAYIPNLTPETTYYYRAYVQEVVEGSPEGSPVYGDKHSFTTPALKGIDVTVGNGSPLSKNLVSSDENHTVYSVHVPYGTESVNVTQNVYLGTANLYTPLKFAKVGTPYVTKQWSNPPSDAGVTSATYAEVPLTSALTTVCVGTPSFSNPSIAPNPLVNSCEDYAYEIQITIDSAPAVETLPIYENTDTTATLRANATGFDHNSTTVGFELSVNADMQNSQDQTSDWPSLSDNEFFKYLNGLTPGTTYYYRAYVQEVEENVAVGPAVYGNIESFTTAAFTGIDVKDANETLLTKSPSVFDINVKKYTVHVPYNTTRISVSQNVYLGTAIDPTPAAFTVVGAISPLPTEPWSSPPVLGNIVAKKPVDLSSNSTTVCVATLQFSGPSVSAGPCSPGQYEVEIIRDAAPQAAPEPPKTVKVIVTDPSQGGNVANVPVTQLGESRLPMSAQLFTPDGKSLNLPDIAISADGTFVLPNVPAGQYHMVLSIVAPTGEKLAGRPATLTVDASGNAQIESELIDPYGIITDAVTGQVIEGAHATLHWADTALNRSKGRTVDALVILPILPDFAPNQNRDPQDSNDKGEYGWMVFPDGDYYILATKAGYNAFDSRTTGANKDDGDDSYIKNGIIHIGQSIESYDFMMDPIAKETGTHNNYIAGYPDGSFGPDRNITRAEVAAVFARITNNYQLVLDASDTNSFNDVSSTHWAKEYIENVRASGLMLGATESSFLPESPITRGEVAAIIARFKKLSPVEEPLFSDTLDYWASSAINAVKKANIIDGYEDGTFRPNQKIVRKEFVIMINHMLGRGKIQNSKQQLWSDVPVTDFYFADIQEASTTHDYAIYTDGIERLKEK